MKNAHFAKLTLLLVLCAAPVFAQDVMLWTPQGPQPYMYMPAPGTMGGSMLIPMLPQYSSPVQQWEQQEQMRYERQHDRAMRQIEDTRRAVDEQRRYYQERFPNFPMK